MLTTAVAVESPHSQAFCGYPVSKNKQARALDPASKTFTARCYTYFGFADFSADFREFTKSRDIHMGLHYGPGTDDTGRELTTPPSPKGASGGGTWLVPDFKKPLDRGTTANRGLRPVATDSGNPSGPGHYHVGEADEQARGTGGCRLQTSKTTEPREEMIECCFLRFNRGEIRLKMLSADCI